MTTGKNIFGAFTVAIALFFFWPGVVGSWQRVAALRAAAAARQELLAKRTEILANVRTAFQEYQSKLSETDGKKFAELVPVHKDTAEIISAIQDMAGGSGVTLSEIRMSETAGSATAQFKTLSMNLQLAGSYRSLRTFLTSLEQYVRLLNVDTIEATADTRTPGQLKFAIRADAYFLK